MNILVTAGPTREPLDPVRFLSNRSSGRMGYAVAAAAAEAGHEVVLVSGPVHLEPPQGVTLAPVTTAAEMCAEVERHWSWCEALVMVAAVADWRPVAVAPHKLKKDEMRSVVELERTEDILARIAPRKDTRIVVGFAAETENVLEEATRKLHSKNMDLVVANDVSCEGAGFETETNEVTFIMRDGSTKPYPRMSKRAIADEIIAWLTLRKSAQSPK
jgi:phosphopantothenoylcysteine decarboxylase/phosphopantothenate--cysteine ligase